MIIIRKMKLANIKKEEGFWSALIVIFLVTLGLMGLGVSVLIRSEGKSVAHHVNAVQIEYVANAGAYYGIQRLHSDSLDESEELEIGNGKVTLDTSDVEGSSDVLLTITAVAGEAKKEIEVLLSAKNRLVDKAIYTKGDVFNVTGKDSAGNPDSDVVITKADTIPSIDIDTLKTMATNQGHFIPSDSIPADSAFAPDTNYPESSFYWSGGGGTTPNVTYVEGDFTVKGSRDVYGIFVVEGNVTLHGSARVFGVIYLPNPSSTLITGGGNPGESSITGGIISHGDISGTSHHISVQHNPEYMRAFCEHQVGEDPSEFKVVSWVYH